MTGLKFAKPTKAQPRPRKPLARTSFLNRGKGLARTSRLSPGKPMARARMKKRLPRRLFTEQNDELRKAWCRAQDCCKCGAEPYEGHPSQACHEGRTGKSVSRKCIDAETFPLCPDCHRQWTDGQSTNGFARHWDKAKRREWAEEMIALATSRWLSHGSRRSVR